MTSKFIEDLIFEAVNSACRTIQEELEINDGGFAGEFFMDKQELDNTFKEYIISEINNKIQYYEELLDDTAKNDATSEFEKVNTKHQYYKKLLFDNIVT